MFLQRVEMQGFKSFASRAVFSFEMKSGTPHAITCIVGPNGSGKSNFADAVRWVLGEQSMKTLRGKKSDDVIFAGSDKKGRLGMAEVSLHLNNEKDAATHGDDEHNPLRFPEIVITRRLFRDGTGEYLINGARVRLSDIQLMLAQAHFGQKTYTVIGQGLIDQILLVSPKERKEFFDEAAGVKEFQIKRHQALLKLHATRENITQAEQLLAEIEPRVRSLQRAVKRLEERGAVEYKLQSLQRQYYGTMWHEVHAKIAALFTHAKEDEKILAAALSANQQTLAHLHALEVAETQSEVIIGLQREYENLTKQRGHLREEDLRLKTALEVSRVRAEAERQWAPLPLTRIIEELDAMKTAQHVCAARLRRAKNMGEVHALLDEFDALVTRTDALIKRLQRPAPETEARTLPQDPQVQSAIEDNVTSIAIIDTQLKELSERMHAESHREQKKKSEFFSVQRQLQDEQRAMHTIEQRLNDRKIELARHETRADGLREEMRLEIPAFMKEVMAAPPAEPLAVTDAAARELYALKHQLELIGGIDPEVMEEFQETNTRYTFLSKQLGDLNSALANTEQAITEFDEVLRTRRTSALATINVLFQDFFAKLFRGGTAKLVPQFADPADELAASADDADDETEEDVAEEMETANRPPSREPVLVGIEIHAQPPGKRIKDISMLSGGERALTSVALLCAILASNPSPFVVLDEVDAALDEANSVRYAEILEILAQKTQFMVITHNRATMAKGEVLYGVTMGDDGVSQLLSVKFGEAERWAK